MENNLSGYAYLAGLILVIGGIYWAATSRQRQRFNVLMETSHTSIELARAHNKTVEENTAAIRELIRKLDEQKG